MYPPRLHLIDFSSIVFIGGPGPLSTSFYIVTRNSVLLLSFNPFWKILRLGNLAWDIFRVHFWSRDFFGFCVESPRDFFWGGLIITLIRSSPSFKIQSTLPPSSGHSTSSPSYNVDLARAFRAWLNYETLLLKYCSL